MEQPGGSLLLPWPQKGRSGASGPVAMAAQRHGRQPSQEQAAAPHRAPLLRGKGGRDVCLQENNEMEPNLKASLQDRTAN